MFHIVKIEILYMYESCERHSYFVRVTTNEGLTREVEGHQSSSIYNPEGISREEARDRALIDAATWGDFLGITPEPYIEDGEVISPSMKFNTYTYQREMAKKRAKTS